MRYFNEICAEDVQVGKESAQLGWFLKLVQMIAHRYLVPSQMPAWSSRGSTQQFERLGQHWNDRTSVSCVNTQIQVHMTQSSGEVADVRDFAILTPFTDRAQARPSTGGKARVCHWVRSCSRSMSTAAEDPGPPHAVNSHIVLGPSGAVTVVAAAAAIASSRPHATEKTGVDGRPKSWCAPHITRTRDSIFASTRESPSLVMQYTDVS